MRTHTDVNQWYVESVQEQLLLLTMEEIGNNRFVKNLKAIDKQYYILLDNLTK